MYFGIHLVGYRILGSIPSKIFPFTQKMREKLLRANVKVSHVVYISSMFFWSITVFALSFGILSVIFEHLLTNLGLFVQQAFTPYDLLLVSILFGILVFAIFWYYPSYVSSNLKRRIEKNMVYTANYMAILTNAGATPGQIFSSLAKYGEIFAIKESAISIIKNVELLGEDILSALDLESKRTPSREYGDFLQGYIATLQIGGNVQSYLAAMSEKFMERRRRILAKMIDQLTLVGEVFIAGLIAMPVIMISLLAVMGFVGGEVLAGLTAHHIMTLITYVFIPFVAIALLIFIDVIMSSW
ncbi:MAG: type II secretion system F family protein [Nitrososphaerota archaeon]|nr:type II secretion system F family protein [Candidatus Bathyarchaeota archaeon]MDW8049151.1 type II secretion system F family protein [Nitrososphaerota archaeon]